MKTFLFVTTLILLFISFGDRIYSYVVYDHGLIVITGATSGLGLDAAKRLASMGFTVLAGARNEIKAKTLNEQTKHLPNLIPIVLEVTNKEHISNCLKSVLKYDEPLVALINNAGVHQQDYFDDLDTEYARKLFDINVLSIIDLTHTLLPELKKSKGRIINLSSLAGISSAPQISTYSASKAAVRYLSSGWRMDLLEYGISVSTINPGYVESGMCSSKECKGSTADEVTTPAIVHAVTNARPFSEYTIGWTFSFPAIVVEKVQLFLPIKIWELINTHTFHTQHEKGKGFNYFLKIIKENIF